MRRGRGCRRKVGQSKGRKEEVGILFTYEKKARALQSYEQTQSVWEMSKLIRLISNCHHTRYKGYGIGFRFAELEVPHSSAAAQRKY